MKIVNIYEAKTQLSRLIKAALDGSEVIIGKNNTALVRIVPYVEKKSRKRKLGLLRGQGTVPEDFNQALPDDVLAEFYKSKL